MEGGIDQLGTRLFQGAPKLGRNPLGDAGFDPPFGVDQRGGARAALPASWSAGSSACAPADIDEPAHQVLVRARQRRLFVQPVAELKSRVAQARRALASRAHVLTTRLRARRIDRGGAHSPGANQIRVGTHAGLRCASLELAGARSTRARHRFASAEEFSVRRQGIAAVFIACWLSSSVHAQTFARVETQAASTDPGHHRRSGPQRGRSRRHHRRRSAQRRERDGRRPAGQAAGTGVPRHP